jgi:hypothetical protein
LLPITAGNDTFYAVHDRLDIEAAPGVLAHDTNVGSGTAVLELGPTRGSLVGGLSTNGSFKYMPAPGIVGDDTFTYHDVGLLGLRSNTATVTITVTNAAPSAVADSYNAKTGVTLTVAAPGVLANDTDADGDALTASLVSGGGNGSLALSSNGAFTFTSGGSFTGLRTFTYQVSDGLVSSSVATVSIQVTGPAPTPAPTRTPTPAPTPAPTPTPTPNPVPTVPLPTLPVPVPTLPVPVPTLPVPRPTLPVPRPTLPVPTPTLPVPSIATPIATPAPTTASTPGPSSSTSPTSSVAPAGLPPSSSSSPEPAAAGSGAGGSNGGPGESAAPDGPGFTVATGNLAPFGLIDLGVGAFDSLDWAVPALALSVPGLLLIAILAQLSASAVWLPIVRRWLGGFGVGRRRRRKDQAEARANT